MARARAASDSHAFAVPCFAVPGGGSSAVTVIETSTTAVLPSTGVLVSQAAHSASAGRPTKFSGTRAIIWNVSLVTLTPLIATSALRPPPSPAHLGLRLSSFPNQDVQRGQIVRTSSLPPVPLPSMHCLNRPPREEDWVMRDFQSFYEQATGHRPYGYQARIARDGLPDVLRAPTGAGKTGVILAWLWRRLVYALPLRSLVAHVSGPVRMWLVNLGLA